MRLTPVFKEMEKELSLELKLPPLESVQARLKNGNGMVTEKSILELKIAPYTDPETMLKEL